MNKSFLFPRFSFLLPYRDNSQILVSLSLLCAVFVKASYSLQGHKSYSNSIFGATQLTWKNAHASIENIRAVHTIIEAVLASEASV